MASLLAGVSTDSLLTGDERSSPVSPPRKSLPQPHSLLMPGQYISWLDCLATSSMIQVSVSGREVSEDGEESPQRDSKSPEPRADKGV